ncbi:2Fe-2S iron-sulfur cluster-binding protein [Streptomyces sp. NPDC051322]|uniref:2Fe-2S iron-sulfur cluster-binding protein n=1 Tax=Streptomyces sp. NPDC051322 TaxID=3154645 RepID=UPI00344C5298
MTTNDDDRGGWQPVPQGGDYDAEATAFVQLPEDLDFDHAPLAAPGHGFVPPMILPLTPAAGTDPAATGSWSVPQTVQWPEAQPQAAPEHVPDAAFDGTYGAGFDAESGYDPRATGQWTFSEAEGEGGAAPEADAAGEPPQTGGNLTGQWTIPVAGGNVPEESGEFTTSSLTRPATLPGGAPAPWALPPQDPEPAPEPADTADENSRAEDTGVEDARVEDARSEDAARDGVEDSGPPPHGTPVPQHEPDHVPEADPVAAPPAAADEIPAPGPEPESLSEPDPEPVPDPVPLLAHSEHTPASYVLRVNGSDRPVTDAWIGESLLYVLRERLGLAGAKDGCSQGECGACNVQVDGRLVASCLVPAATAAGSEVRTVEGLAVNGEPSDVQRALADCGAVQCGFCIPGMAMTVHDLLEGNHAPTELETRQALSGNLCRCTGYRGVLDAVGEVVAGRAAVADVAEEARIPHQAPPGAGGVQPPHPQQHDGGMA